MMQDNFKAEPLEETEVISKKKNRTGLLVGGVVALVILLAGAAFVGGRLLNAQSPIPSIGGGSMVLTSKGSGGEQRVTVKLDMEPAKELPQTPAEVKGLYQRRQDSSIFIGTGQVKMMAQKSQDGTISTTSSFDGPVVEVVVTHDTVVYQDVTMKQFNGPPPAGQKTQQVVEPGNVDDIGTNSTIVVWGERRGDRVVATTLVYSPAAFMVKPGGGGQ